MRPLLSALALPWRSVIEHEATCVLLSCDACAAGAADACAETGGNIFSADSCSADGAIGGTASVAADGATEVVTCGAAAAAADASSATAEGGRLCLCSIQQTHRSLSTPSLAFPALAVAMSGGSTCKNDSR